ncbi:MAG: roadblock/LC7 domain-containing protein [Planctomycetota bacterium]|nr:roadblock/LC7 domain-containing protein [Planctomycetota bacterium]MCX8039460.1 roadblock/LC7 domain-containing protein [Planctomycetota bacterium]MDW8373578.1 roadblock/LC7 domain-containing protein [Planctomycetota bacterium]
MSSSASSVSSNEALRLRRLVFYAAEVEALNAVLASFVKKSGALSALLVDLEGHMVARQGFAIAGADPTALAALVAASFASTRQVAKLLGEQEFTTMHQAGSQHVLQVQLIAGRTLALAVFPTSVKPGMIQVLCQELAKHLEEILSRAAARGNGSEQLAENFSSDMKHNLERLFGDL